MGLKWSINELRLATDNRNSGREKLILMRGAIVHGPAEKTTCRGAIASSAAGALKMPAGSASIGKGFWILSTMRKPGFVFPRRWRTSNRRTGFVRAAAEVTERMRAAMDDSRSLAGISSNSLLT